MGMSAYKMIYGKACHLPFELEYKAYWPIKELNYDFKLAGEKRLFDINSLDEWRTQAYENPKLFKEKVKRWHDKRIQMREFKVGEYVLLYNSRLRIFAGKLLSKWEGTYIIKEVYLSRAIKINNPEGTNTNVVNGQRIKHYISGTPINVETNIIQTMTSEEHIRETFHNTRDPLKGRDLKLCRLKIWRERATSQTSSQILRSKKRWITTAGLRMRRKTRI
uniref:Uncharacterized protein n=1 Tax=Hordeum vulgare subsp. vulgare TaxID=112509 RepID=A0A8I6XHE7_HORVV